jgi:large conductance mechanosensitive channel
MVMWQEFKKFAMRGNIMDLAIGIIVGGAFIKIVDSLVNDLIMPFFGLTLGHINLSNLFIQLGGDIQYPTIEAAKEAGVSTINYGLFINSIIQFLVITFTIFMVVRQINRWRDRENVKPKTNTKSCPYCLCTIHFEATKCPHCTSYLKEESVRVNIHS